MTEELKKVTLSAERTGYLQCVRDVLELFEERKIHIESFVSDLMKKSKSIGAI